MIKHHDHLMKKTLVLALGCLALGACRPSAQAPSLSPYAYAAVKRIVVRHGAVVTAHPLASAVGARILRAGGNAVDAAVASALALAVVYPAAGNLGGGGFMVIHLAGGKDLSLDFREKAPGKAFRDMFLDSLGRADTEASRNGPLSAGVPGTVAGLCLAHERYGALPWADLVMPAEQLAAGGFVLTAAEARHLNAARDAFRRYNAVMPVFVRERPWAAGDTLVQRDLAATLERIRGQGRAGFYEGITAAYITEEMQRQGGLISGDDLRNYQAVERVPVAFDYRGYRILSMPLPSSGGLLLRQMLGMLQDHPIAGYGFLSRRSVQLMTEIERRAYADRAQYLGDPDFVRVPVDRLVDPDYLRSRMADYDPAKATPSRNIGAGRIPESEETTHLSVVDSSGNAVSMTYTLNNSYGSKVVVGHAGFLLNDEMDDFSAKPGAPNMFGLVGHAANAIAPGKRMLSSMTPTIVLQAGKPYLVLGTPGGATIITSVFQTLVDILDFDMSLSDAVNRPKFHHQWQPDLIDVEKGFPDTVRRPLEAMGYTFRERSPIGRTEVIRLQGDSIEAVADGRGDDSAAGY